MSIQKKKKSSGFGMLLFDDRFNKGSKPKPIIQRNSVTEFTNIALLNERMELQNKQVYNSKEAVVRETIDQKYPELIASLDFSLSIPPRVPFEALSKEDFKELEAFCFNRWKYINDSKVFERNIEIWRQFWLSCERADIIAQIVDSRNVGFFLNQDIIKMYPNKKHLVFCNKMDLIPEDLKDKLSAKSDGAVEYFLYSTKADTFSYDLSGTIAMIGYPNVGKSSTINLILNQKKVRVSSTPGKTKYIQTIETPNFTLLDCPGLVFPRHSKIDLVLMGILNIDQVTDVLKHETHIINLVGAEKIKTYYKLKNNTGYVLENMSLEKGWVKSKCLKTIVRDYSMGEMPFF